MICKNNFVSRNQLIITHHASKRTVYSKFKITIDFNYILSRKAVRIAKTAALKFGEFLVCNNFVTIQHIPTKRGTWTADSMRIILTSVLTGNVKL